MSASCLQRLHSVADRRALRNRGERAHARFLKSRIARLDLGELRRKGFGHRAFQRGGNEDAADGRAFLAGLDRHLPHDFLDENVEFGRSLQRVRPEHSRVQRVAFGDEAHGVARDGGVVAQLLRGLERAGEGEGVLAGQVVEQVAGRPGDELEGALGQDAGCDDEARDASAT